MAATHVAAEKRAHHGDPRPPEPEARFASISGVAPQAAAMAARSSGEAGPCAEPSMSPESSQSRAWIRASERSLEVADRSSFYALERMALEVMEE